MNEEKHTPRTLQIQLGVVTWGAGGGTVKAYLDIETAFTGEITVVGLYAPDRGMVQLVGGGISELSVWRALEGVRVICTYNGSRFDVPVIHRRLGLDLRSTFICRDLMLECWRRKWYGGLKRVEERLGIPRRTHGIDGADAMRLWHRYETTGNREALATLLEYNREDVLNLEALDRILQGSDACA